MFGKIFKAVTKTVTKVADWISDVPERVAALGGVATGMLDYYGRKQDRKHEENMARQEREWIDSKLGASSGDDNYGSHHEGLVNGLLTGTDNQRANTNRY